MKIGYASLRRGGASAALRLAKKNTPKRRFRLCGVLLRALAPSLRVFCENIAQGPTLRALDRRRLLKKAGENFHTDTAVKSPTNQNLKDLAIER